MGCRSDHMLATDTEIQLSRVASLLDELDGKPIRKDWWRGYHPRVYNRGKQVDGEAMTEALCAKLQFRDVTQYSLEMQIWWRDHQEADRLRHERERAEKDNSRKKAAALAKLTPEERRLLGV